MSPVNLCLSNITQTHPTLSMSMDGLVQRPSGGAILPVMKMLMLKGIHQHGRRRHVLTAFAAASRGSMHIARAR
jgi:hypothetical protein